MSLATIVLVVASIVIIALLWRFVFGPRKAVQEDPEIVSVEKESAALAKVFYKATQSGEKTRNLVRVYRQTDVAAIKALLASEGIAIVQLGPRVNAD